MQMPLNSLYVYESSIDTVRLPVAECLNYGLRFMRTYFSTDKLLNKLLCTLTSVKTLGTPQNNEGGCDVV